MPAPSQQAPASDDITTIWHACRPDHADVIATHFYLALLFVALLVIWLWADYRKRTADRD